MEETLETQEGEAEWPVVTHRGVAEAVEAAEAAVDAVADVVVGDVEVAAEG